MSSFMKINILSLFFESFQCISAVSFCIDVKIFCDLLKCSTTSDVLELSAKDSDHLDLIFHSSINIKRKFNLNLFKSDMQPVFDWPEYLNYQCKFEIKGEELTRIVNNLSLFSNFCDVEISKNGIVFCIRNDIITADVCLLPSQEVKLDLKKACQGKFSLKRISNFNKCLSNSMNVYGFLENNSPLILYTEILNSDLKVCVKVDFLIALMSD